MRTAREFLSSPARAIALGVLGPALVATRLVDLGARPVMHDESMFAYYSAMHIAERLDYQYLPILHGPAMLWVQALVFHVFGFSDYTMRLGCA